MPESDAHAALTGKVALVTGASSGIGEATATVLANAGASVALGARRVDRVESLSERLSGGGTRTLSIELDVDDEDACGEAVRQTQSKLGGLDILVNNAGVMLLGPIVDADTEDWRRMINTNVLGLMYMTHAAVPSMVQQGSGEVVNISSVAGRIARAGSGVYNASKWAVNAFSEALRQEVTETGVRVSLVEPGAVATELTDHITHQQSKQAAQQMYDSMRALRSEDIANAVLSVVTQPPHVAVNEILVRPTDQVR